MRIPLLLHLGAASQAVPLIAALVARRRLNPAVAWTVGWCAFLVAWDAASLAVGWRGHRNLFLTYFFTPVGTALALWTLSHWQRAELARLTLRLAIVPVLIVWGVLTFAVEDTSSFSKVADPLAGLVGLGAAAFTLVARSCVASGLLRHQDWFWVSAGMVLYFGTATMLQPLSSLLIGEAPQLVVRAFEVKSVLDVVAFVLIARGVTCRAAT